MSRRLRIAYFAHTLRSDWNNGNAHFLRGLMRALGALGHQVTVFEPTSDWSIENLRTEPLGEKSLADFTRIYPDLNISTYRPTQTEVEWSERLRGTDIVILHEWNPPALANLLLRLRGTLGYKLLFHDTHHRASSSPESFATLGLARFDGVLAFGEALRQIYIDRFGVTHVWTLHEAADTTIFFPDHDADKQQDVVWIGNWGDDERSAEIREFLLRPAAELPQYQFAIYGVRYPEEGLSALRQAGVQYRGYLPNLDAPAVYASSRLTVHVPRQQYTGAMTGIPTIRVFEALACGIPLISAPWQDTEHLFREGDFLFAPNADEMKHAMQKLLNDPGLAAEQAERGLETVLTRHTCAHRARELTSLFEELLG